MINGEQAELVTAVHGSLCNGGFFSARSAFSDHKLQLTAEAFELMHEPEIASLIRRSINASDSELEDLEAPYLAAIPDDEALARLIDVSYPPDRPDKSSDTDPRAHAARFVSLIDDWASGNHGVVKRNRIFDRIKEQEAALRATADGRRELECLVDDPRDSVALFAAAAVGEWDLPRAANRLHRMQDEAGTWSFEAKYTLRGLIGE